MFAHQCKHRQSKNNVTSEAQWCENEESEKGIEVMEK